MNEGLPKLVVERLRTAVPNEHPDADLLTAFAEKTLSTGERDGVLQHLAACADCRGIVALATPEQAVVPPPLPTRTSWLNWPYLRWGAALACVVVVGAAVTLRQQKHASQAKLASPQVDEIATLQPYYKQRDEPAPPIQNQQEVAGTLKEPGKDNQAGPTIRKAPATPGAEAGGRQLTLQARNYDSLDHFTDETRADSPPARAKEQNEAVVTGAATMVAENKKDAETRGFLKMAPATTPPIAASETVEVAAAAPEIQTESASVQKAQATGGPSAHGAAKVARAASGNLTKMSDARITSQRVTLSPSLGAQWTLSPEGVLQRSLDSGATWTPVAVAANVALRAVSASGSDVWVGGAGGALFHSFDNGERWTQVRPSVAGKVLTGDIVGLEFKDLAHGQLTTTYELWTTCDGGKTWVKSAK